MSNCQVPDAPSTSTGIDHTPRKPDYSPVYESEKPGFWTVPDWGTGAIRTNRELFHDKMFLATQSVWFGTEVFDIEVTHQGLAHQKCIEADGDNRYPSRGELYRKGVKEYAAGTALNWLFMRYFSTSLIVLIPAISGTVHTRGGDIWLENCW